MSFVCSEAGPIRRWTAHPTADHVQGLLRVFVSGVVGGRFLRKDASLTAGRRAALSELICYFISRSDLSMRNWRSFPLNALTPFSPRHRPGVELVHLQFAASDSVTLQRVEALSSGEEGAANRLIDGYRGLFGPDPEANLHTRMQAIANEYRYRQHRPELAARTALLIRQAARMQSAVRLLPTLVVDGENPGAEGAEEQMQKVIESLRGLGWENVTGWVVVLDDLDPRLELLMTETP